MTAFDEAVLRNMGDEALGIVTSCWYSAEIENAINKRFAANFRVDWGYDPGSTRGDLRRGRGARSYLERDQWEHRGQAGFHEGGARHQVEPPGGRLHSTNTETWSAAFTSARSNARTALVNRRHPYLPEREPFWTYKPEEFLKNPVYSRDGRRQESGA